VPVVANVLRAYGIVMLAHLSDFEIAVGVDHLIYGYIFLSLVTVILIAIGLVMRDPAGQPGAAVAGGQLAAPSGPPARGRWGAVVVALLLVSLVGVRGYAHAVAPPSEAAGEVDLAAPDTTGTAWQPIAGSNFAWQPQFPAADAKAVWGFAHGTSRVDVFLAHYRFERSGAELIAEGNQLADLDRSEIMARGIAAVAPNPGWPKPAFARLAGHRRNLLVWYWYVVDGTVVNTPYRAKLERILAQFGGPVASSVVAVATEEGPEAPARLRRFLREVDLARTLPGVEAAPK
jgi:EpsI family protein